MKKISPENKVFYLDYFNMLSSIFRCDDVAIWSICIHIEKFDSKKEVVFREGLFKTMSGDILLPYAYLNSLLL